MFGLTGHQMSLKKAEEFLKIVLREERQLLSAKGTSQRVSLVSIGFERIRK